MTIKEYYRHYLRKLQTIYDLDEASVMAGWVFESKAGRQAILGKVVVDATGDLDVAVAHRRARAGATALGATGYLSSEGNLAPRLCVALIDCIDRGDRDTAARVHREIMEIHDNDEIKPV